MLKIQLCYWEILSICDVVDEFGVVEEFKLYLLSLHFVRLVAVLHLDICFLIDSKVKETFLF